MVSPSYRRAVDARAASIRAARLDVDTRSFVRDIFNERAGKQYVNHLKPNEFATAVRQDLDTALTSASGEISRDTARWLLDLALEERDGWIRHATFKDDKPEDAVSPSLVRHAFLVCAGRVDLGRVRYTVCPGCRQGVLDKITIHAEVESSGLGRRALSELQRRWPDVEFNTTGQFPDATGFYERVRSTSPSPWLARQDRCSHLKLEYKGHWLDRANAAADVMTRRWWGGRR